VKVHFTDRATDDLEAIHAYLVVRSPLGARNVQLAMQSTFTQLADFRYLGHEQTTPTLRKIGVPWHQRRRRSISSILRRTTSPG
jgi:plasmid stabilization system protein ParE